MPHPPFHVPRTSHATPTPSPAVVCTSHSQPTHTGPSPFPPADLPPTSAAGAETELRPFRTFGKPNQHPTRPEIEPCRTPPAKPPLPSGTHARIGVGGSGRRQAVGPRRPPTRPAGSGSRSVTLTVTLTPPRNALGQARADPDTSDEAPVPSLSARTSTPPATKPLHPFAAATAIPDRIT
ncbi:unnamed protein product [Diplocarpon coronariae]